MHTVVQNSRPQRMQQIAQPIESPSADPTIAATAVGRSNSDDKDEKGSVWWWLSLFLVFIFWGWVQNRDKVSNELKPENVKANLHNLTVITIAAVIGIIGGQVVFVKLAGLTQNVPVLNKATAYLAKLFSAA